MLLSIRHVTELAYDRRISESVMQLRMVPRSDSHQTLRGFGLAIGPSAPVFEHVDWLGNRVHQFSVVDFHDRLVILAHSAVEMHASAIDLDRVDDPFPLERPDAWRHHDYLQLEGPLRPDPRLDELIGALELREATRAREVLDAVTMRLGDHLAYRKGVTTSATDVSTVLDQGAGVCQDFAHLGIALLREVGIPARYVSGYLGRRGDDVELETHAWLEAHLPSAGWVALDPTHRVRPDRHHVAIAVGRSFADVPPNRGVYRGDASERIAVRVRMEEVEEVPRGLLAPRAAMLEVPTFAGVADARHREAIDYQQEQQQQ